jgi:ABC-type uncharacterized transport system permease subunit
LTTVATPTRRISNRRFLSVQPRVFPSLAVRFAVTIGSIVGALLVGAILIEATGGDAWNAYKEIVSSSFGSHLALSQTLELTTPLVLTALATVVCYRFGLWSIGMDGQLILGAIFASGVALKLQDSTPTFLAIMLSFAAGIVGGMLWALIPAVLRVRLRTNEVISTLMLNFVAFSLIDYLIVDVASLWRDPASVGHPQGAALPTSVLLPKLFQQLDIGILIAIACAVGVWLLLRFSVWGFQVSVLGDSPKAAPYAGINVRRVVVVAFLLSGGLCGLAGAFQVTNVTLALDKAGLTPGLGLGYTGIVVAMLARLQPLYCVPVAVLMAALLNAGPSLEFIGIAPDVVLVLQGTLLLFVVGGQFFVQYRVSRPAHARAAG